LPLKITDTERIYSPPVRYIWRPDAISLYESLWSILNKFAYLNDATTLEVKKAFADDHWQETRGVWSNYLYSLTDFNRLDRAKIQEGLELTSEQMEYSVSNLYEINRAWQTVSGVLRFCPVCIKNGFHSPLFQQTWLEKCPLHRRFLIEKCPSCSKAILYSYADKSLEHPYACKCGYMLWPGIRGNAWKRALRQEQINTINNFFSWYEELIYNRDFAYLDLAEYALMKVIPNDKNREQVMRCITQVSPIEGWPGHIFKGSTKRKHSYVDCGTHLPWTVGKPVGYSEGEEVKTLAQAKKRAVDVINYFSIINSFRRYLKNRVLRKHKRCLEEYRGALVFKEVWQIPVMCRCAHAYYLWDDYWDKYSIYWCHREIVLDEDTGRSVFTDIYHLDLAFQSKLNSIIGYLDDSLYSARRQRESLVRWITQHVLGLCLANTFEESWQVASKVENMDPKELAHRKVGERDNSLYLYMLKNNKHPDRIHIWCRPILEKAMSEASRIEPDHYDRVKRIGKTQNAESGRHISHFAYDEMVYSGNEFVRKRSNHSLSEEQLCKIMNYVPSGKHVLINRKTPVRPEKIKVT